MIKLGIIATTMTAIITSVFLFAPRARAEEPKFLITWRTDSYAPPTYTGKLLPTANSRIAVSLELIDGGKIADLSGETIYWYLNEDFLKGGQGLQEIVFPTPDIVDIQMRVRAQFPHYKNQLLMKSVDIPVVSPQAIIESNLSGPNIHPGTFSFSAKPYFFNVNDESELTFNWLVNNQGPQDQKNPESLSVEVPPTSPQTPLSIQLTITNPQNVFEQAVKTLNLVIAP